MLIDMPYNADMSHQDPGNLSDIINYDKIKNPPIVQVVKQPPSLLESLLDFLGPKSANAADKKLAMANTKNNYLGNNDKGLLERMNNSGLDLIEEGKYSDAELVFKDIIKTDPNHSDAYGNLGYALRKQGKYKEAIDMYSKSTELTQDEGTIRLNHKGIANAYKAMGNKEKALAHILIYETLSVKLGKNKKSVKSYIDNFKMSL